MQHAAHGDDPKLTKNRKPGAVRAAVVRPAAYAYTILGRLRDDGIKAPLHLLETGCIHWSKSMNTFVVPTV